MTAGPASAQRLGSKARVVIVEDHTLFAESLELALFMDGYDVKRLPSPTDRTSTSTLTSAITRLQPRIVLLDLDLGSFGDSTRVITPLARAGANVVVVTASTDQARWGECLVLGARCVIPKTRPLNEVLSVVRRIDRGQQVITREQREALLAAWRDRRQQEQDLRARLELLTTRERQILGELMRGRQVPDIARSSVVSEATVRTQVKSILAKLGVSSQLAAVGIAHQLGWRPGEQ